MVKKSYGTEEDAKDIFHDSIIVFYKKCTQPEFELTARISTFIYAIAQNKWKDKLRKKRYYANSTRDTEELLQVDEKEDAFDQLYNAINSLLESIGSPCKDLILLHEYKKLSFKVIAKKQEFLKATDSRLARSIPIYTSS